MAADLSVAGWTRLAEFYAERARTSVEPAFWLDLERQARSAATAAKETETCTEEETRSEAAPPSVARPSLA